jgi:hypothetical protein
VAGRGGFRVRVTGINELARSMRQLGAHFDDLNDAFSTIARQGARLASEFAPVRTGRLAKGLRGTKTQKNKAVVRVALKSVNEYAGVINYGWPKRNIQASEFMQKADAALLPYALDLIERDARAAIRSRGLG